MSHDTDEIGVPNLDAATDDDLVAAAETFFELARYCKLSLKAREKRLSGYIQAALRHEAEAEAIYNDLPKWARW